MLILLSEFPVLSHRKTQRAPPSVGGSARRPVGRADWQPYFVDFGMQLIPRDKSQPFCR
jgi:hypothetical protein